MSTGSNSRAEQTLGNATILNRQAGPLGSNKPNTGSASTPAGVILPPTHDNALVLPTPPNQGGPVNAASGHIWPKFDFSENLQIPPGGAAAFTLQQFQNFAAHYVSFAVPAELPNRKLYAYYNVIFPNVGIGSVLTGTINLWRKGKLLTQLPISLFSATPVVRGQSLPFICGSGAPSYDSIGLSLSNLQAGEASPVSLISFPIVLTCDKVSVDLDPVNSTATNISSIRIWVGCFSH